MAYYGCTCMFENVKIPEQISSENVFRRQYKIKIYSVPYLT